MVLCECWTESLSPQYARFNMKFSQEKTGDCHSGFGYFRIAHCGHDIDYNLEEKNEKGR